MTKPSEIIVTSGTPVNVEDAKPNLVKRMTPSNANVAKKQPKSTPVRNPAFREHAGLRELQKQLNSQRPAARKNK